MSVQLKEKINISVETLDNLSEVDLADLCNITEQAIDAGGGFGWIRVPTREILNQYWIKITKDNLNNLVISPDTLKENLSLYLSYHRLITDSIDIVDASIINIKINYVITIESGYRGDQVIESVNQEIKEYFDVTKFQIDQPIIIGEVQNIIMNVLGVQSIISLKFLNQTGFENNNIYSSIRYPMQRNIDRGMIFPPTGGIFEIKYPNDDIIGSVG